MPKAFGYSLYRCFVITKERKVGTTKDAILPNRKVFQETEATASATERIPPKVVFEQSGKGEIVE